MKSITVELEYDESVVHEGREVESKLNEQLQGTGFQVVSVEHNSSNKERQDPPIKEDRDASGAGGQTTPPYEKAPNEN
ncbi:hypothetical protein [Fictibacillus phosphorivorans]|uniref:hypothetical protein n=1 Tax=Fictibacillus phosphorivorans TaxID=1221500 RepID=UPI002040FEA7|nr:hypothetical protein [Fictibacillus phosphorivorans]MCM3719044.1 hypothetical protein [Fictibacillus phosphorivorans]MCM3776666.1 hypothetical protein [Fictibacillus phosphorivorans]